MIVNALRRVGASVQHLHTVGDGCPDIAVGWKGQNFFMEIKDGSLIPSKQKLTPDEARWHSLWNGHKCIVRSPDEALEAIGIRCVR